MVFVMNLDLNVDMISILIHTSSLLFFVFDPFASIPIFITLTKDLDKNERKKSANRAVMVAGILFILFVLFGNALLSFFGISLASFKIAGGLVLLLMSLEIILGINMTRSQSEVGWVVIATPILTGPGVITTAIVLTSKYGCATILVSGAIALLLTWILLRKSELLIQLVGKTVIDIFSKVIGLLIGALAVEFVMDGIVEFL
jgi:multiple antibiotic resistance protein